MRPEHQRRLTAILMQIAECCGEVEYNRNICNECNIRIKKCSRLVGRWKIPLIEYAKFVQEVFEMYRKDDYEYY